MLHRNPKLADHLTSHGVFSMSMAQATEMLSLLMRTDATQVGFMHMDWQRFFAHSPHLASSPRFSELAASNQQEVAGESHDVRALIRSARPSARAALAEAFVTRTAATVLRLGIDKFDADRTLSEMGLDSLMAFELIHRLEDGASISLSTTSISADSTIRTLANVILEAFGCAQSDVTPSLEIISAIDPPHQLSFEQETVGWKQVIVLRDEGNGPPVFFIHQAGGGTEIYADLVAHLPQGFPVYGIQSRVLAGAEQESDSLDEMSCSYAELISSVQPGGALRLAGFSAGGVIALATARQLERRGRTVSFTGIIDTPLGVLDPGCPREFILTNMMAEILDSRLGEMTARKLRRNGRPDRSIAELANEIMKAPDDTARLDRVKSWFSNHGVALGDSDLSSVHFDTLTSLKLIIRHAHLIDRCALQSLAGPVWVWQAAESWLTSQPGSAGIRAHLTRGKLTETPVGGRHFESMRPPHVSSLIALFAQGLAESEQMANSALETQARTS
jgi:thioesterase domain-containing protein/acyl carrier protein